MLFYTWKVKFLKKSRLNLLWRHWKKWRGHGPGQYSELSERFGNHVLGRSFVDIGCMWGVDGEYSFFAEQTGSTFEKG